jgi:hypothetical protein
MTKKHFIALADAVIEHNKHDINPFTPDQLATLAKFCWRQNPRFYSGRWFDYIAGVCGPNGGAISAPRLTSRGTRKSSRP